MGGADQEGIERETKADVKAPQEIKSTSGQVPSYSTQNRWHEIKQRNADEAYQGPSHTPVANPGARISPRNDQSAGVTTVTRKSKAAQESLYLKDG